MNLIKAVMLWQQERNLHKMKPNHENEVRLVIEEMLEGFNVKDNLGKKLSKQYANFIMLEGEGEATNEEIIDCYFDACVYLIGAMMKRGYNPELVFEEGMCEINSRTGKIIDGKFEKDKSPEAMARWYKADYSNCKL